MDKEDMKQTTLKTRTSDDSQLSSHSRSSSYSDIDDSEGISPSFRSPTNSNDKIDLNEIISQKELVCVKLYRDDCPYCLKIEKDFEKIKNDFPNAYFICISPKNAEYKDIRSTYNIPTVPSFIVFISSKPTVIVGSDKLQEVRDLLEKQVKSETIKIKDIDDVEIDSSEPI